MARRSTIQVISKPFLLLLKFLAYRNERSQVGQLNECIKLSLEAEGFDPEASVKYAIECDDMCAPITKLPRLMGMRAETAEKRIKKMRARRFDSVANTDCNSVPLWPIFQVYAKLNDITTEEAIIKCLQQGMMSRDFDPIAMFRYFADLFAKRREEKINNNDEMDFIIATLPKIKDDDPILDAWRDAHGHRFNTDYFRRFPEIAKAFEARICKSRS